MTEITTEQEAQHFLDSFSQKRPDETSLSINGDRSDEIMIRRNQKIIDWSNKLLQERLDASDWSLQVKDIIQMRSDSFKQNQSLKGRGEDVVDTRKLIPSVINIQIINN